MAGNKNRAPKKAKIAVAPEPEKKPKFQDPCIDGLPLAWRFSGTDRAGPFGWSIQPDAKFREVVEKLHEFEAKNWDEIMKTGSHPIAVEKICKDARDRLAKIKRDDVDELMSFRLTGPNRVWCIQAGNIMRALWWDPDHKICPTKKSDAETRLI